jgi:mutator protein MutT
VSAVSEIPQVAVAVVAQTRDRKFLVQQYRGGLSDGRWGFAGGKVDPGETPYEAACRELYEEAGVTGTCWEPLDHWSYDRYDEQHYVCVYFSCSLRPSVVPEIREPDKTRQWKLVSPTRLRSGYDLIPGVAAYFEGEVL